MPKRILIVEDDPDIAKLIANYLNREGYAISTAQDGASGLKLAKGNSPDLLILDLMLPEIDGLEVCKALRGNPGTAALPIMMLTAKGEESDRIVGLELGADDYVTKPFSPKELVARVKALLRRSERPEKSPAAYTYGPLVLDETRHDVKLNGKEVRLTAKEFGLLAQLLKSKGRVLTREVLLENIWGYDANVSTRTVDVHIRRLREKIPILNKAIITVMSHGYKLKEETD
ncbi:MAG TPA: response regulator transcription factor [Nitrospiria bacterium]|nr:response regulator transcription factor [Nitrospiria bacterium]